MMPLQRSTHAAWAAGRSAAGFGGPAATDLEAEDEEAAATAPVELGVSVPAFAANGVADRRAGACVSARVRPSVAGDRADQSGVDCQLGAVPRRQAIAPQCDGLPGSARRGSSRRGRCCGRHGLRALADPRNCSLMLAPRARERPEHRTLPARWSPSTSSVPRQEQLRGASGRGKRSRRSSRSRNWGGGTVTSSQVRTTVGDRAECGPACGSSNARDAGHRSARCVSSMRSSQAWAAARCQASSQVGTWAPSPHKYAAASAAAGSWSDVRSRSATEGARAWMAGGRPPESPLCRMTVGAGRPQAEASKA